MFDLFNNPGKNKCPVPEERRLWLEAAFLWMMQTFGENDLQRRKIFLPDVSDFPQIFDQTENDAYTLLPVVATQMETDPAGIELQFYSQERVNYSGGYGGTIFAGVPKSQQQAKGFYHGKGNNGRYVISLELGALQHTEGLVATLAHEIAHIKLLGEERMNQVDEDATDLLTVFFGFGIFNANSSFSFSSGFEGWSYNTGGYLRQQDWGYALALFCFARNEKTLPCWINFLSPNVRGDMKQSWRFIDAHPEKIFSTR